LTAQAQRYFENNAEKHARGVEARPAAALDSLTIAD
jgi:hypothetical protein